MTQPTTAHEVRSFAPMRHGAYVCLDARHAAAGPLLAALAARLGLVNEFLPGADHPGEAIAFLRRLDATPRQVADDPLLAAPALVHVASASRRRSRPCARCCAGSAIRASSPARSGR
jgi:hypothetical protein